MENARRVLVNSTWYEKLTLAIAILISLLAFSAWWYSEHTIENAVHISEPAFLGLGALSIVLLAAQLRSARKTEEAENVWKRIVCYHEYFSDVPSPARAEVLRAYFHELEIEEPPSAYRPLDRSTVLKIWSDKGNSTRPPGKVIICRYLSDWEDFCGAISVGVVDEDYAREMEGSRVIDVFFGYRPAINLMRELRNDEARTSSTSTPPFAHKPFLELQKVATKWHNKRVEELAKDQERIARADLAADAARTGEGVPAEAR